MKLRLRRARTGRNAAPPFEQQPRESSSLYLSLGPERSTAAVAAKLAKSGQLIPQVVGEVRWKERVAANGTHLAIVEREAIEAVARGKAAEWESREKG